MPAADTAVAPAPEPWRLTYTPVFVLFTAYTFMILTYRASGATVVMVLALVCVVLQRAVVRAPAFLWVFAAWVGWAGLSYTLNPTANAELWDALLEHAKLILVVLVAVNALGTPTQIRRYLLFVVVSFMVFPARSTLQNYVMGYTVFGRAVGPFIYANSNDLAAISLLVLGPAFALWASEKAHRRLRWIGLGAAAALIVVVILTQSRGGFLGLAVVVVPSAVVLVRRRPRTAVAMAVVLAAGLFAAPASFWQRMGGLSKATSAETVGEMDPEGSAKQRFAVLETATRIIGDHPVLGVGLGGYPRANAEYSPALGPRDTHNTYLNVAAETGIPGLLIFLALVGNVLWSARDTRPGGGKRRGGARDPDRERQYWLRSALAGYLVAALFGSYARLSVTYIFISLVWAAARAAKTQLSTAPITYPTTAPHQPASGSAAHPAMIGSTAR
jgi:O-antigen ligase